MDRRDRKPNGAIHHWCRAFPETAEEVEAPSYSRVGSRLPSRSKEPARSTTTTTHTAGGYNVAEDYVYDNPNRLDVLTTYKTDETDADFANLSGNKKFAMFDYGLNFDGKRSGVEEWHYDANGVSNTLQFKDTYTWTCDGIGRLKQEQLDSTHATLKDYNATYTYDLAGNRLTRNTRLRVPPIIADNAGPSANFGVKHEWPRAHPNFLVTA